MLDLQKNLVLQPRQYFEQLFQDLAHLLFKNIDASNLALFRILFGLLMIVETGRYFVGFIDDYYVKPTFHFHYVGFSFVQVLPPQGMYAVFGLLVLSAALIALGLFFRVSCLCFFFLYTYVFLVEKACYNNHYYLICLLSFLLAISDANKIASVDAVLRSMKKTTDSTGDISSSQQIEAWQLWMLKLQMVLVYFFAGVAKLNADWLKGEPMRMWLAERAYRLPALAAFFNAPWSAYFFSYGGLWLDLSAGFLLLWKPTRVFAIVMISLFHIANHFLFGIGIFPFLALASTVLFIEPESARRFLFVFKESKIAAPSETSDSSEPMSNSLEPAPDSSAQPTLSRSSRKPKQGILICFTVYFALQIFLPLRHWLYGGNVSWTEEGHNFSWHMKLRDKKGYRPRFIVIENGVARDVDPTTMLTRRQLGEMNGDPDLVLEFAQHLRAESIKKGFKEPVVIAEVYASMNGRPLQRLVHHSFDMGKAEKNFFKASPWIVPLAFSVPNALPWMSDFCIGLAVVSSLFSVLFLTQLAARWRAFLFVPIVIAAVTAYFPVPIAFWRLTCLKVVLLWGALLTACVVCSWTNRNLVCAEAKSVVPPDQYKTPLSFLFAACGFFLASMSLVLSIDP